METKLEPFEERMVAEFKELNDRTNELESFLVKNQGNYKVGAELPLLQAQLETMVAYRSILCRRLNLHGLTTHIFV